MAEQPTAELIHKGGTTYLHYDGFLYLRHSRKGLTSYWRCQRKPQCAAKITIIHNGNDIIVKSGGDVESHEPNHAPNPEEVEALKLLSDLKREAREHPEAPPSRLMRRLQDASPAVLAQLPDRMNVRKQLQREHLKEMPSNPVDIEDLESVPDKFRRTKMGDIFLLYDSFEDDDFTLTCGRIIIFTTRENLKVLFRSPLWYVDGTFSTVPSIFFQMFAVMGSVNQVYKGVEQTIALPLVYALMKGKEQIAYAKIFQIISDRGREFGIQLRQPPRIMSDFELAIINAAAEFGGNVHLCLFHLCQSVYRFLCKKTYVHGKKARGRAKAVAVRYAPVLWNHYQAVLDGTERTNNASEGWHNRFQMIVGKKHPSLYTFLAELQHEQGDTQTLLRQIQLGQAVRKKPDGHFVAVKDRIMNIVMRYDEYVEDDSQLKYIKDLGHYLHL
ncbi:unnamed protein product [Trichogramma brassicae]|uniref:FLYWCH-type domain-containing protein n=1 Tax=Trichogramma brassicae TaxID=86971 RepID=A0A6H5J060_9HYME|nr:unnamed protein product [Trichogramma brassicae]